VVGFFPQIERFRVTFPATRRAAVSRENHPVVFQSKPNLPWLHRWWNKIAKRIDLERQNRSHASNGYLLQRLRRAWDLLHANLTIALELKGVISPADLSNSPNLYRCELLKLEHGKALRKYVPRPYEGDVLLFRATKQLRGHVTDDCLGWKQYFKSRLAVCDVAGHQENLMLEPNVRQLASELSRRLNAVKQGYAAGEASCSSGGEAEICF
jgi:hypothetical protein